MKFIPLLLVSFLLNVAASPYQEPIPTPIPPLTVAANAVIRITQLDTSQFPKVTAYVSVTDSSGEPVAVDPANLVLKENEQVIPSDQIQGKGEVGPLTTMLVMDISGTMNSGGKLKAAKAVAQDYVNQMRPGDQAGIISFNIVIRVAQEITSDRQALLTTIDGLKANDDTAMYDALMKAVDVLNPLPGRKAIIVLTDGLDNRSKNTPEKILESIGQKGLSISTVGFGVPGQGSGNLTALDEKTLTDLAGKAGGRYGFANDQASLQNLFELYGRALKSEYVLSYISPSTLRDGVNRSLTVSLSQGGEVSTSQAVQTQYNPGGLVPEVGGAAPWALFFILLGGLLVILLIPTLVGFVLRLVPAGRKASPAPAPRSAASTVRGVPMPGKPRIKLK